MALQAASLFEQFWSHFPARHGRPKVGKQKTLELFRLLDEAEQADAVIAAKHYAKASKPRGDGVFVPEPRDPERFLRGDWYRDWLDIPAQQCQFRSIQTCENLALTGEDVCEYHKAYRERLTKLRQA